MATPNWTGKRLDLIKEACRHGEARLAAQVQIATSADQRATVLAGIYVAAATGVIGAIAASELFRNSPPLLVGSCATAVTFLIAAILCILATLPVDFWTPGNDPEAWYPDMEKGTSPEIAIGEQTDHFNRHITSNNEVIARNAKYFMCGALLGVGAPAIGIILAGLVCLFIHP
jgi:hypothetical protein